MNGARLTGIAVAGLLVATGCCRLFGWQTIYALRAPDGRAELRVETRNCFADCAVRVVVQRGFATTVVAERSDCDVSFAHAAWRGPRVGLAFTDAICQPIWLGYDTAAGSWLDFEVVSPWLAASIIKAYGVTPAELADAGGDVYAWTASERGRAEFRRRSLPGG